MYFPLGRATCTLLTIVIKSQYVGTVRASDHTHEREEHGN